MAVSDLGTGHADGRQVDLAGPFRAAMSRFPSGLAAVTGRDADGGPCGLLVSSIASYSDAPPSLILAVAQTTRTHAALMGHDRFGVHVLTAEQEALARRFAGSTDDKFDGIGWEWDGSVPRLHDVLAYMPCRRRVSFPHGDHTIVVGEVLDVAAVPGTPLIYLERRMDWRPHDCGEADAE